MLFIAKALLASLMTMFLTGNETFNSVAAKLSADVMLGVLFFSQRQNQLQNQWGENPIFWFVCIQR